MSGRDARTGERAAQAGLLSTCLVALAVASALAVATPVASQDGSELGVQELVDRADPGEQIHLRATTYNESVRIDKPLTLTGEPGTRIHGESRPAVVVQAPGVHVEDVVLSSTAVPLQARDVGDLTLSGVAFDAPRPARIENVGWTRVFDPAGEIGSDLGIMETVVVEGHDLEVIVSYDGGLPAEGVPVTVVDGNRTLLDTSTGDDGRVAPLGVADRWTRFGPEGRPLEQGPNHTRLLVDGVVVTGSVGPEVATMQVNLGPPPAEAGDGLSPTLVAAGGAAATLASLAALFRFHEGFRWRWIGLFSPLYTRLARSELLEHETRDAIYEHVEENPGTHLRELQRRLELKNGTLYHHLRMLQDQDVLRSVEDGMYRRFYVVGAQTPEEGALDTTKRVLRAIQDQPGATNGEIAEAVDELPSNVHYHVSKLVEAGDVEKRREGRYTRLFPSDGMGDGTGANYSASG